MNTLKSSFFENITLSDVKLRVHNLERMLNFYRDQLGLREIGRTGSQVALSATGEAPALIILTEDAEAPARPPRTIGLFHVAFLLPDRTELATVVRRLIANGVVCVGASDHGVSEAFYFSDPEGNGVELYSDRPADDWPLAGDDVAMVTDALDHRALLALGRQDAVQAPLPAETRVGHIHLSVPDLAAADKFLTGVLGLALRQRNYPGALFFGYDGYHHHIAANTWLGTRRPPSNALGLVSFSVRFPGESHVLAADLSAIPRT